LIGLIIRGRSFVSFFVLTREASLVFQGEIVWDRPFAFLCELYLNLNYYLGFFECRLCGELIFAAFYIVMMEPLSQIIGELL
jgi:hypothetical protein